MNILVTGAKGFIGENLVVALKRIPETEVSEFDLDVPAERLDDYLTETDFIYHLAGIKRPESVEDFQSGNADFTKDICGRLQAMGRAPCIVFSSPTQAELDNHWYKGHVREGRKHKSRNTWSQNHATQIPPLR